jgi:hypothetical protein
MQYLHGMMYEHCLDLKTATCVQGDTAITHISREPMLKVKLFPRQIVFMSQLEGFRLKSLPCARCLKSPSKTNTRKTWLLLWANSSVTCRNACYATTSFILCVLRIWGFLKSSNSFGFNLKNSFVAYALESNVIFLNGSIIHRKLFCLTDEL